MFAPLNSVLNCPIKWWIEIKNLMIFIVNQLAAKGVYSVCSQAKVKAFTRPSFTLLSVWLARLYIVWYNLCPLVNSFFNFEYKSFFVIFLQIVRINISCNIDTTIDKSLGLIPHYDWEVYRLKSKPGWMYENMRMEYIW